MSFLKQTNNCQMAKSKKCYAKIKINRQKVI